MKQDISAVRLRDLLDYDPETGTFRWRQIMRHGSIPKGSIAGCAGEQRMGITITIDGRGYRAHRLAWLFVHGRWPLQYIDHINCNPHDNRIANLREATPFQSVGNTRTRPVSGFKGVRFSPLHKSKPWRAQIRRGGKKVTLGYFETAELASAAYLAAAREVFGEFARAA